MNTRLRFALYHYLLLGDSQWIVKALRHPTVKYSLNIAQLNVFPTYDDFPTLWLNDGISWWTTYLHRRGVKKFPLHSPCCCYYFSYYLQWVFFVSPPQHCIMSAELLRSGTTVHTLAHMITPLPLAALHSAEFSEMMTQISHSINKHWVCWLLDLLNYLASSKMKGSSFLSFLPPRKRPGEVLVGKHINIPEGHQMLKQSALPPLSLLIGQIPLPNCKS